MRTVQLQQTDVAALVAKGDQLLVQNLDPQRQILQLVREADRLPEAAHVLAARRAGTDMGELGVLLGDVPVEIPAIPRLQERGSGRHRRFLYGRCELPHDFSVGKMPSQHTASILTTMLSICRSLRHWSKS